MGAGASRGRNMPFTPLASQTGSWGTRYPDLFSLHPPTSCGCCQSANPKARGYEGPAGAAREGQCAGREEVCGDWPTDSLQARAPVLFRVSACKPYCPPSLHSNATAFMKPSAAFCWNANSSFLGSPQTLSPLLDPNDILL